ncbi:septal ring lytic transglycosylase RlpA family protein [Zhengella sp. ZM62]|uniref:septal ring lytic transglycosylase RlpA family protein n=1 Tax=Zhengella sedimenti TaxID=3390035 RepID=UPI003975ADA4
MVSGFKRAIAICAAGTALIVLAACAGPGAKTSYKSARAPEASGKEYFPEAKYGVKASPRVTEKRSRLKRGGGREQIGKPYRVAGKWYHPKKDPNYSKVGKASWYGNAFHGRLTANGEVYDMTHLSAAHPTMPLPSYARVTNMSNGASVIVRVNDRGPFAHNRIIDLSRRAAELLDYKSSGVATVRVDYVGPAPIEGENTETLMASYNPGNASPATGMSGVMLAMADTGPSVVGARRPEGNLPGVSAVNAYAGATSAPSAMPVGSIIPAAYAPTGDSLFRLPDIAPVPVSRPGSGLASAQPVQALSYASERVSAAASAFASHDLGHGLNPEALKASWRRSGVDVTGPALHVGTFADRRQALAIADALKGEGRSQLQTFSSQDGVSHVLTLHVRQGRDENAVLRAAWNAGAPDAFFVRD